MSSELFLSYGGAKVAVPKVKSPEPELAVSVALLAGKRLYSASYALMAVSRFFISVLAAPTFALVFAMLIAGRSKPARIAIIAITTNNSISVNARTRGL